MAFQIAPQGKPVESNRPCKSEVAFRNSTRSVRGLAGTALPPAHQAKTMVTPCSFPKPCAWFLYDLINVCFETWEPEHWAISDLADCHCSSAFVRRPSGYRTGWPWSGSPRGRRRKARSICLRAAAGAPPAWLSHRQRYEP